MLIFTQIEICSSFSGATLGRILIDLSDREFAVGLTYTALSRCKKFSQLAFSNFPDYKRMTAFHKYKYNQQRLKEDLRLKTLEEETIAYLDENA